MTKASNKSKRIEFFRGALREDGVHSSERLVEQLRRGEVLRVRRGIYVPAKDWAEAAPWVRYEIVVSAAAMSRSLIFCRETALVLHGIPLLNTPKTVFARTADPGAAKRHSPSAMTGKIPPQRFQRRYAQIHPDAAPLRPASLSNVPLKLLEPACPAATSRTELRAQLCSGEFSIPEVLLHSDVLAEVIGPEAGYRTEPLGLASLDATSRMSFTEAVVVLDAVKARGDVDVEAWLPYLHTQRQRVRWERAWNFADGRSESALESESRAVLAQLNFPVPTLQKVVRTRIGDFRLDFCWERDGVVGEVDGKAKYFDPQYTNGMDPAELHYREKLRREAIEGQGWRVVRWGKKELRNPQELITRLSRSGLRPIAS